MKKLFKKKAFTMVEMLVCLVCIGFLSIGIGSFASAIKGHTAYVSERESDLLHEYQDVLNLKSYGLIFRSKTNHPEYIHEAHKYVVDDEFYISDHYAGEPNQKFEYESSDINVITVDSNGTCNAVARGVAYIKIKILTLGNDGEYHDLGNADYVPFIVADNEFNQEFNSLKYYFYGGEYYVCWLYDKTGR
jgi:hypothetical protein